MINGADISLEFIKKEEFTGSYRGMRYLLAAKPKSAKDGESEKVILAVIWPEPYNYGKTPAERKQQQEFPLTKEGKDAAVEWLNTQYTEQKSLWNSAR